MLFTVLLGADDGRLAWQVEKQIDDYVEAQVKQLDENKCALNVTGSRGA